MITQFAPSTLEKVGEVIGQMISDDPQDQQAQLEGLTRGIKSTIKVAEGVTIAFFYCEAETPIIQQKDYTQT